MIRPPPRSTRTDSLFPSPPLFRSAPDRRDRLCDRACDVERDDLRAMRHAGEPFGALRVGDDQLRFAVLDPRGEFAALPPAVEQGGAAARHQDADIGDAPRIGVAHRDPDAVAALDAMPLDEPRGDRTSAGTGKGVEV